MERAVCLPLGHGYLQTSLPNSRKLSEQIPFRVLVPAQPCPAPRGPFQKDLQTTYKPPILPQPTPKVPAIERSRALCTQHRLLSQARRTCRSSFSSRSRPSFSRNLRV